MGKTFKELYAQEALSKNHGKSVKFLKRKQQELETAREAKEELKNHNDNKGSNLESDRVPI